MRIYPALFRGVLRRIEPETAHRLAFPIIRGAGALGPLARGLCAPDPQLQVHALGLRFPSPFGVAAGFDKNAEAILGLGALGFGHVEVGTLTMRAQPGNAKPRVHRLVEDRALINRMGFNNEGSEAAVARLERARMARHRPVIGVNIGKSRVTPLDDAIGDYVFSAQRLAPLADYLAVNVSSPNTPGLRGLQELKSLKPLLTEVQRAASGTPLLVKISPDVDEDQLVGMVELAQDLQLAGVIATNTTVSREGLIASASQVARMGEGGLSGEPLKARSLEVLRRIRSVAPDPRFCVISVGGVTTPRDVLERLESGATLVQGYTGFIYEGPLWARDINRGLAASGFRGN